MHLSQANNLEPIIANQIVSTTNINHLHDYTDTQSLQMNYPNEVGPHNLMADSKEDQEQIEYIDPRQYQIEIYKLIEEQWFSGDESVRSDFGSIVFMATGSGKTFVAIMLILKIFELANDKLMKLTGQ